MRQIWAAFLLFLSLFVCLCVWGGQLFLIVNTKYYNRPVNTHTFSNPYFENLGALHPVCTFYLRCTLLMRSVSGVLYESRFRSGLDIIWGEKVPNKVSHLDRTLY